MMITLTLCQVLIMVAINVGVLAFLVIDWFRRNYTIVDIETWNKCAEAYNEKVEREDSEDLVGGLGSYFSEYYVNYEDEQGDEEDCSDDN